MHLKNLVSLLVLFTTPLLTLAYPSGAGTCDATSAAISGGHGPSTQPNSGAADGFTLSTTKSGGNIQVSINGSKGIKGFLLYAVDQTGVRFGTFSNLNSNTQTKACAGNGNSNTITHTSSSVKKLPLQFTWSPGSGAAGNATFKATIVQDKTNWNILDPLNFDVTSAVGSTASSSSDPSTTSPSSSSPSPSSSSASSMQLYSFISLMYTTYGLLTIAMVFKSLIF